VNCPAGTATTDTENQGCNHCQGNWGGWSWGNWIGSTACGTTRIRPGNRTYYVTKAATNGGNPCPFAHGHQERKSESKWNPRCPPKPPDRGGGR
jgi:hypothetical protein